MLKTTTDTLPQPVTSVGRVTAEIGSGMLSTERSAHTWLGEAEDQVEAQTQDLGGDAIIGIRVTALVGTLMVIGTAVKLGSCSHSTPPLEDNDDARQPLAVVEAWASARRSGDSRAAMTVHSSSPTKSLLMPLVSHRVCSMLEQVVMEARGCGLRCRPNVMQVCVTL